MDRYRVAKNIANMLLELGSEDAREIALAIFGIVSAEGLNKGSERGSESTAPKAKPERDAQGEGKIMLPQGYRCWCASCRKEVYEIKYNVLEKGVGINVFLGAFGPIGHSVRLERDNLNVLKDKEGNMFCDCPVCNGKQTLQIVGKPGAGVAEQISKKPSTRGEEDVMSIGQDDV